MLLDHDYNIVENTVLASHDVVIADKFRDITLPKCIGDIHCIEKLNSWLFTY